MEEDGRGLQTGVASPLLCRWKHRISQVEYLWNPHGPSEGGLAMSRRVLTICLAAGLILSCELRLRAAEIHDAIREGNLDRVKRILDEDPDLANSTVKGERGDALHLPIECVAYYGRKEIAEVLLDRGAAVNQGAWTWSPLDWAIARGHKDVAELLVAKGARLSPGNAAGLGMLDVVKALAREPVDRSRLAPIIWAAYWGHKDVVEFLLSQKVKADWEGYTPLHAAAENGQTAVAELLIEKGADIEAAYSGLSMKERMEELWSGTRGDAFPPPAWATRPLHLAASYGHKDVVELLIAKGARIEARDTGGATPLLAATRNGHKDIVVLLLARNAQIETKDLSGYTPLLAAAENGHKEVVELLLDRGTNLNTVDKRGRTAVYVAAYEGHTDVVRSLVARGADVNAPAENSTPLFCAVHRRDTAMVKFLLRAGANPNRGYKGVTALHVAMPEDLKDIAAALVAGGADVNAKADDGQTPLLLARRHRRRACAQVLAANGADLDIFSACWLGRVERVRSLLDAEAALIKTTDEEVQKGKTPLAWAADGGSLEVVRLLVARGADVQGGPGPTPLGMAVGSDHKDVVRFLLANGVDVNTRNPAGGTVLFSAAGFGPRDMVALLLEKGAHANVRDGSGETALHSAAAMVFGRPAAVAFDTADLLIAAGADVNAKSKQGLTPLYDAAAAGYADVVELLLAKGARHDVFTASMLGKTDTLKAILDADPESAKAPSKWGWTALHLAACKGQDGAVALLVAAGADVNAKDQSGQTPLATAVSNRHYRTAALLRNHGAKE